MPRSIALAGQVLAIIGHETNNLGVPRPSRAVDEALLRAGRELLPALGCRGLTQRALAAHAGVQPGMFHYHFGSKDAFLRALLQQLYEELFAGLVAGVAGDGPAVERLQRGLLAIGGFVRAQHALVARLAADAIDGSAVVHEFMRDNAPRHLGVLLQLLQQAEQEGTVAPQPPLQRLTFLLGATLAPMLVAPGVVALGLPMAAAAGTQVTSDAALASRIRRALQALRAPEEIA